MKRKAKSEISEQYNSGFTDRNECVIISKYDRITSR